MTSRPISHGKLLRAKRRRHLFARVAISFATIVLAWAGIGIPLFVSPATAPLSHADVLLVLSPTSGRMAYAEHLMDAGYANALAVSAPQGLGIPEPAACNERRTYRVICFDPQPVTTQGESRALQRLSYEYGWASANVLTAGRHVTRARVLMERCNSGDVNMISYPQSHPLMSLSDPENSWAFIYSYETAAFIKVALNQDC